MKGLTTLILILTLSSCLCWGKGQRENQMILVETDIVPILTKGTGIHFAYSFTDKWAVYAGGCIWLGNLPKGASKIEQAHSEGVDTRHPKEKVYDFCRSELGIQYWPSTSFKGHFISTGIRYGSESRADAFVEYGYRITAFKGFGVTFSIKTGILSLFKENNIKSHLINIGIGYEF